MESIGTGLILLSAGYLTAAVCSVRLVGERTDLFAPLALVAFAAAYWRNHLLPTAVMAVGTLLIVAGRHG